MIESFLNLFTSIVYFLSFYIACILTGSIFLLIIASIYWCIPTSIEKIGNLIDNYKEKKAKKMGENVELREWNSEKYEKEKKEKEEYEKKYPIRAKIINFLIEMRRILWYRVPEYPYDIKRYIKMWYQRANRGWADSDVWGFYDYLAKVISEGCIWLRKNKQGVPCQTYPNVKAIEAEDNNIHFKKAEEKWNKILNNIIWTFHIAQKIYNNNWIYPLYEDQYFTKEEKKKWKKWVKDSNKRFGTNNYHIMTKKEIDKYRKGWKYFQQYFGNLWD